MSVSHNFSKILHTIFECQKLSHTLQYLRVKIFFDHGYDISRTQEEDKLCTQCMELHPECRHSYQQYTYTSPGPLCADTMPMIAECEASEPSDRLLGCKADADHPHRVCPTTSSQFQSGAGKEEQQQQSEQTCI
jgi:hypothetical protein